MKFVDLSQHLRQLRSDAAGRNVNGAMNAMQVWQAAEMCPKNGISKVYYNETRMPAPLLGFFARMRGKDGEGDIADIYVHRPHPHAHKRRLEPHWKEFVIIKELMHCWSPESTYVGTPAQAAELLTTLNSSGPFGAMAISDHIAILAAAEVIMPCAVIKNALASGKELAQLAHEQGLHPEIMAYIGQHDMLDREDGCL